MGSFDAKRHCHRWLTPQIEVGKARGFAPFVAATAGLRDGFVIFAVRQFTFRPDLSAE
jgi:hypothetical protein